MEDVLDGEDGWTLPLQAVAGGEIRPREFLQGSLSELYLWYSYTASQTGGD